MAGRVIGPLLLQTYQTQSGKNSNHLLADQLAGGRDDRYYRVPPSGLANRVFCTSTKKSKSSSSCTLDRPAANPHPHGAWALNTDAANVQTLNENLPSKRP